MHRNGNGRPVLHSSILAILFEAVRAEAAHLTRKRVGILACTEQGPQPGSFRKIHYVAQAATISKTRTVDTNCSWLRASAAASGCENKARMTTEIRKREEHQNTLASAASWIAVHEKEKNHRSDRRRQRR